MISGDCLIAFVWTKKLLASRLLAAGALPVPHSHRAFQSKCQPARDKLNPREILIYLAARSHRAAQRVELLGVVPVSCRFGSACPWLWRVDRFGMPMPPRRGVAGGADAPQSQSQRPVAAGRAADLVGWWSC